MGLRIQNNVEAFNTHRQLTATASQASKSMEKLSSGYRINRAADDAAGLAISEKMRGQIGGLAQAQRNAQDGISLVQTAEGALSEVHSMLQRVRDLKVQYSNGTLDADDKTAIAAEVGADRPGDQAASWTTRSSTARRCSTTRPRFTFQVGANDGETISTARSASDRSAPPAPAACRAHGHPRRRRGHDRALAGDALDDRRHRHAIKNVSTIARRLRRGPEPPRASPEQPGDLPGEPDRVRVADPRRGHGRGDDQVHEARTSCSRPARACSRRPTRRRRASSRCCG